MTGLAAGDTLKAIDYRPANGMLYGIGLDVTNTNVRTYVINPTTGVATAVGVAVPLPVAAMAWDINFNPTVDRIRVVNDQDENARLHPDFGTLAGDDTNLNPVTVLVDGVAYTNPFAGATSTTLYALNAATNSLATIGGVNGTPSPNGGLVTDIGPLGVTFAGSTAAFDIATNNVAYAVLRPTGGALTLYTVDLELWTKTLERPATYAALLKIVFAVVITILVLAPRWSLQQMGLAHHVPGLDPAFPAAWWLPWRWRETLIGFPLLVYAMFLIDWRLDCPDCASLPQTAANDPRGWFLVGLLAPIGIVTSVGQGAVPARLALAQTAVTLLSGALLGAAAIVLRLRHRPKGPSRQ